MEDIYDMREDLIEQILLREFESELETTTEEGLSFNTWTFGQGDRIDHLNSLTDLELLDELGDD